MRELFLFFEFKPLTINQAFITLRNGRRAKSKVYTQFQSQVQRVINQNTLKLFASEFDSSKHELHLDLIIYLKEFYTKKNIISKKSGDLMNFEKVITDIVFKNLPIDDSFITTANLSKNYGDKDCFCYRLEIRERARTIPETI